MKTFKNWAAGTLAVVTTVLITGCGSELNKVTGKVTLDGKPVQGLEVRFEPVDPNNGTTAMGYTKADGTYELHYPGDNNDGAPPGEFTVHISGAETDGEGPPVRVAKKYNSKSTLTATVEDGGDNVFNFDVTSAE